MHACTCAAFTQERPHGCSMAPLGQSPNAPAPCVKKLCLLGEGDCCISFVAGGAEGVVQARKLGAKPSGGDGLAVPCAESSADLRVGTEAFRGVRRVFTPVVADDVAAAVLAAVSTVAVGPSERTRAERGACGAAQGCDGTDACCNRPWDR
mmetsp:Transcript_127519/g.225945  ORF Transcript_127519/g.225945 Transcript_127519/m.225945 type:complete len:151 (+) Transcript_127519:54-506(+)